MFEYGVDSPFVEADPLWEATLTVRAGDVMVWKNEDVVPHTATAKGLDTGTIAAGESRRYTAQPKGT